MQLDSETYRPEPKNKNAEALAWIEEWVSTPDDQPPGYWDELEEVLKDHLIVFDAEPELLEN